MGKRLRVLMTIPGELGAKPTAPEIRGFELAKALAERHDVTLAADNAPQEVRDGVRLVPRRRVDLAQQVRNADVFMGTMVPPYLYPVFAASRTIVVADLYNPVELELAEEMHRPEVSTYVYHLM